MITQKEINDLGVTRLEFSRLAEIPYGTLCSKMNGYSLFKESDSDLIEKAKKLIRKKKSSRQ